MVTEKLSKLAVILGPFRFVVVVAVAVVFVAASRR